MDVTLGEMAALCDYTNNIECRSNVNFMSTMNLTCLLCGVVDVSNNSTHSVVNHLDCKIHKQRQQQYYTCYKNLLAVEKSLLSSCASAREVVLTYLNNQLAQTVIVSGKECYNNAAVGFLLKKISAPELLRAFGQITANKHASTRGVCSVCLERPSCIMFESCRHVCTCSACAARLNQRAEESQLQPMCPICRKCSKTVAVFIT